MRAKSRFIPVYPRLDRFGKLSAIAYIINPTLSTADLAVSWVAEGNSENMIKQTDENA
jgi:hypothetical protein